PGEIPPRRGATSSVTSDLRHADCADHHAAADEIDQAQGMQDGAAEHPLAEPNVRPEASLKVEHGHQRHDHYTGGNGSALEVFHLAAVVRERIRRGIEAGQAADAARHKIE